MRILRGQSNLEVSSKGFALFVVGLVFATFIGGAVRTVLNSAQFHQRIASEIKNRFPRHEFQIGRTEVILSRGIWPALGVRVSELTFKQDVCGKLSFLLTLPRATLPLSVLSLLRGNLRLTDVELEGGELHLDYHDCAPQIEAPTTSVSAYKGSKKDTTVNAKANAASVARDESPKSISMPKLDFRQAGRVLDGLVIKNFAVTYEKNPTWKLVLNSAYLGLGEEILLQAQVEVQKSLPFGTITHALDFDVHGDQNVLHWNFNADYKEGHVRLSGSVDMNNQAAEARAHFRQVPLRDLSNEIFQAGLSERELNFKSMWLSCSLKWEGRLLSFAATPVNVRDCRVEGSYGHAELASADISLSGDSGGDLFKSPAHIKISKLQIGPAMEALKREVLPAVLPRLGLWSGTLDFSSENSWTLNGVLENLEIVFSNQSVMGKQVIDSIRTKASRSGAKTVAQIHEVKIREGEFSGGIDLEMNGSLRDGNFHARIDKLLFSPSIQKLLVGGKMGALKGQGQGVLSAGELSQWSGGFSLSDIKGEGWMAHDLQVHSRLQNGSFEIESTLKSVVLESSWRLFPQVRLVREEVPDPTNFRDITAKMELNKAGGSLREWRAFEFPASVQWRGRGAWLRDGEFNGSLAVSGGKKSQSFNLRGEKGSLSVQERTGEPR